MRIAQIIDTLGIGGAEKLQLTFAREARAHGLTPTVISLGVSPGSPIPAQLQALGVNVVTYPARRLLNARRLWRITRFLRRERVSVLHTHLTHANIVGALTGRLAGVPVVATLHSIGTDPRHYHPAKDRLETWALRFNDKRVIAVGRAAAEAYRPRLGGKPIHLIPNAVAPVPPLPPAERAALRAEIAGDPARPLLISVGRLTPPKAFDVLLSAFALVRSQKPEARLIIVGGGSLYGDLASQIRTLGLEGSATLLGERDDIPRLLAASDMFVSSSVREGLPLAILEAMTAGLPVVATRVGDVPEAVVAGMGALAPPGQPAALADAIVSLLDHPKQMRAAGEAAQAHACRNYSTSQWFEQQLAVYQEICATPERAVG